MRKKHLKTFYVLMSVLLISGCSSYSEVNETINEAQSEVSKNFEQIGLKQLIIVEPNNGEYSHQFENQMTGKIYLLASRKQIESNTFEEILLNGEELETVIEGSDDDFNIKLNGETYFSVKMIDVENITELNIKTTYDKKLYLYFAEDK